MFLKIYLIAVGVFFAIDMVWLGLIAKNFYAKYLGYLMKTDVNWTAALIFYFLFIVGLVLFVIQPGLEKQSLNYVLIYGALFGLMTYATYDLTNLATIKDWPLIVTVVDMVWGTMLSVVVSAVTYLIYNKVA